MSEQAVANGSELKNTPPNTPNKKGKKKKKKQQKQQQQNSEDQTLAADISLAQTNWNSLKSAKKRKKKNNKKNDENSEKEGTASTVKYDKAENKKEKEIVKEEKQKEVEKLTKKIDDEPPLVVPSLDAGRKLLFEQNHIHPLQKKLPRYPNAVFQCKLCKYHCDNISVVEHHIQDKRHLKAMEEDGDRYTIQNIPPPTPKQLSCITEILEAQIKLYGLDDSDLLVRRNIASTLNDSIAEEMPGFIVRMYGSSAMGIGLKKSDLNLELCVPADANPPKGLMAAYDFISKQDAKYHDVRSDFSAEVPAVIFVTNDTNIQCSLTLSNSHSFKLAELLQKYVSIDERVCKLGIIFRIWAHYCRLDNADLCMWPPYAFFLMLVYFLQQLPSPVLPVLHELVDSQDGEKKAEHYLDPENLEGKWTSENKMSLGELWLRLFKFYTCDFDEYVSVVCIEQLLPLLRNDNIRRWLGKKIAIKDPFMPKRNVSRSMTTQSGIDYCMTCFRNTYKYFAILQTETGPIFGRIGRELTGDHEVYRRAIEANEKIIKHLLLVHQYFTKPVQTPTTVTELENQLFLRAQSFHNNDLQSLVVPAKWAHEMFSSFNDNYLRYEFEPIIFVGNQTFPQICSLCQKEGHYKDDCHEEIMDKFDVTLPPMEDYYMDALDKLCEQVLEKWETPPSKVEIRKKITADIETYISEFYPTAKLELFGSSCNGFGLLKSDIDICLTFTDSENGKEHDFVKLIEELQEKFKKYGPLQNLLPIKTAKVPILKFYHTISELDGDISIYNTLGKQNTRLLRTYAEIDPRAKILGYMIKRFAKVCDMCDASRGSLSSYAYIIMLIYFLQQCDPPVLPVLQELSETQPKPEVKVEDCDTYFYENVSNLKNIWPEYGKNTCSVGELWIKLLYFYSTEFDFTNYVISIRKKECLLRFEKLWTSKCMAIEDPFDLSHNLGSGLSRKMHCYIIKSFRKGYLHFGTCRPDIPRNRDSLEYYFFKSENLTIGDPPNDRGCRICKKIGHLCKDCPQRKQNRQRMGHNRPATRMNPPPRVGMMRNIPPNAMTTLRPGYNPPFTPPFAVQPPRAVYSSPSYRGNYNFKPQESISIRYGLQQTLPPFKSCASPVDLSRKNGVGSHSQFMTAQDSVSVRPQNVHPMMFNNGPLNTSPRVMNALQMTHEQRIQECQVIAQRLGLYPNRNTRIDVAHLKPPGVITRRPQPENVIVCDIPPD